MNPLTYTPNKPEDFIGDARNVAEFFIKLIADAKLESDPLKLLLNGPPGLGKSALIKFLQTTAGIHPKWSTHKFNGTKVNVDAVDTMERAAHYRDLYGAYKLFWIDEADKIPSTAQVRFLTFLDDLPPGNIVACTSNCKVSEFEPRFQSRFIVQELTPVPAPEIESLLMKFLPATHAAIARQIATFANGNVRQALLDLKGALIAATA